MQHPITANTMLVTVSEPFDYLSPGITYLATPSKSGREVRFDREDGSSGTTLRGYMWRMGVQRGIISHRPAVA